MCASTLTGISPEVVVADLASLGLRAAAAGHARDEGQVVAVAALRAALADAFDEVVADGVWLGALQLHITRNGKRVGATRDAAAWQTSKGMAAQTCMYYLELGTHASPVPDRGLHRCSPVSSRYVTCRPFQQQVTKEARQWVQTNLLRAAVALLQECFVDISNNSLPGTVAQCLRGRG